MMQIILYCLDSSNTFCSWQQLAKPDGRTIHFVKTKEWFIEKVKGDHDINEEIKTWSQDVKWVMVIGPALEQGAARPLTWADFRRLAPKVVVGSAVAGVIIGGVGGYLGF